VKSEKLILSRLNDTARCFQEKTQGLPSTS